MIVLEKVSKIYSTSKDVTRALDCIDLKICDGEIVAIMGASGSGKTTLLNILGTMDRVTDGKYFNNNTEISKLRTKDLNEYRKSNISFVFQNFELLNDFTVFENVEMPLKARRIPKDDRKRIVSDALIKLDIIDLKDKYPQEISGGQKQRVAIARAYVCDTSIILADEPTGSLDKENGEMVMQLLKEINREGKTVVVVTHSQEVAEQCQRIITIRDGKIYE